MRIIDYYNYIATAAYILMGVAAAIIYFRRGKSSADGLSSDGIIGKTGLLTLRTEKLFLLIIMIVAAFLRLYRLGDLPTGLQQDEASIGYDAYTIANFGIDRNGYAYPVYPITWGCGGGSPLLIYLNALSIKLFGTGRIKLRLIPALLGIATVFFFYLFLKKAFEESRYERELSLFGALFLAICPWHIILSRWSLDSNIMPFNLIVSMYFFILGVKGKKHNTLFYCLSAACFSICMYSYGSATIVVPLTLLFLCIAFIRRGFLTVKQTVLSGIVFLIIFAPLFLFYAVNYLGVPEIVTPYVCFNKFTAARTGEAFISFDSSLASQIKANLKSFLLTLTIGDDSHMICNFYPGYATLFEFTFPVTLLGIVISIKKIITDKSREAAGEIICLGVFVSSFILSLVILSDINRMVMMFIPLIFFFVKGSEFILYNSGKLFIALAVIIFIAAGSFAKDYFTDYNQRTISTFMPGYGEAITRAYEVAGDDNMIYSTYEGLSAPFMITLYYTEYDPYKFQDTVVYRDETAEFRIAVSFGNFVYSLPDDMTSSEHAEDVFVAASTELTPFEEAGSYNMENYGGYWVVYR